MFDDDLKIQVDIHPSREHLGRQMAEWFPNCRLERNARCSREDIRLTLSWYTHHYILNFPIANMVEVGPDRQKYLAWEQVQSVLYAIADKAYLQLTGEETP